MRFHWPFINWPPLALRLTFTKCCHIPQSFLFILCILCTMLLTFNNNVNVHYIVLFVLSVSCCFWGETWINIVLFLIPHFTQLVTAKEDRLCLVFNSHMFHINFCFPIIICRCDFDEINFTVMVICCPLVLCH